MSIWCSHEFIGWDTGRKRHEKCGGDVRSYATGWSNHYPTTSGKVERRASIDTAHVPTWCVPGHENEEGWADVPLGPWLRLSVDSWEHDYYKPSTVIGPKSATVVMDEDAVRALVADLSVWLEAPKVYPIKPARVGGGEQ